MVEKTHAFFGMRPVRNQVGKSPVDEVDISGTELRRIRLLLRHRYKSAPTRKMRIERSGSSTPYVIEIRRSVIIDYYATG